jgi:LPXTG-site transpeptidase (sortase) family protein
MHRVLASLTGLALLATACAAQPEVTWAGTDPDPAARQSRAQEPTDGTADGEEAPAGGTAHDHAEEPDGARDLDGADRNGEADPDSQASDLGGASATDETLARFPSLHDDRRRDANRRLTESGSAEGPGERFNSVDPTRIVIPAIDVDANIDRVGIDAGIMEVPDHGDAAWFTPSVKPGRVGPSLITGHVSSLVSGPDVFHDLDQLQDGDEIAVHGEGEVVVFEVTRVEQHPKDDYPREAVHGATAGPELRLITCGGFFDDVSGHHEDNIIVFAERQDT